MPKSSKKKKDKAADFAKAKLKLGKGKQVANNATNTSFKARSIALPTQSVSIEKDGSAPTTRRNLNLEDLIVHLKHYNAGIRKDALTGLKELLNANHELVEPSLNTIINVCVRLIADEDALVRKTLLSFLSWFLHLVPRASLLPHASLFMLFTTSALSHIFPEIRIDAIRFLDLLLDLVPEAVVGGWTNAGSDESTNENAETSTAGASQHGRRVLDGYLALFDLKGKPGEKAPVGSLSSLVLSANSKLTLLKSFSTFLHASLRGSKAPRHGAIPTWYLSRSFATPAAYDSFAEIFRLSRVGEKASRHPTHSMNWEPFVEPFRAGKELGGEQFIHDLSLADVTDSGIGSWSLDDLESASASVDAGLSTAKGEEGSGNTHAIAELAQKIHPVLLSTFLDAAPTVFAPSNQRGGDDASTELVWAIGEIAKILYGALLPASVIPSESRAQVCENLRALLGYMAPYFPFGADGMYKRDMKTDQLLQDLSLAYCELTSLLVLSSQISSLANKKNKAAQPRDTLTLQVEKVGEYVVQALQGQIVTISQPLGRPLSAAAYSALLPTIWSLLNQPPPPSRGQSSALEVSTLVFEATLDHCIRTGARSAAKRSATEFVSRLFLLQSEALYQGSFQVDLESNAGHISKLVEWALSLPRLLWELGTGDLAFTESILLFMLRFSQRRRVVALLSDEEFETMGRRLAPLFNIEHPTRGVIAGPFTRISSSGIRRLALDVVVSWSDPERGAAFEDLHRAVGRTVEGGELVYWQDQVPATG